MVETASADICVIGAGSAGLTVAAAAAQLGATTILVEQGRMGGDCLNYGCVPSKSLVAAARAAEDMRRHAAYGLAPVQPRVEFARVHDHVHGVIAAIAPNDSVERFTGLGVRVIQGAARFTGPAEVAVDDLRIAARRFVIATGSSPVTGGIAGLDRVPYLTNETIFDERELPDYLIIVGGGPIGIELGQAYRRLGARVTVIELSSMLNQADPELVAVVADRLRREGVSIVENTAVTRVEPISGGVAVHTESAGMRARIDGSRLLVAMGRAPRVDGLDLAKAGVVCTSKGIDVDARMRTANPKIFAIGDVVGGRQFTHVAAHHASIVIRNALFRQPARADSRAIPEVVYCDPELAHVGLDEVAARQRFGAIRVLRWPFAENDRAQTERNAEGLAKVVTNRRGRILGAGLVGGHAGELILPWILAIDEKLKIGAMARIVAPYPTYSEISKRVAGSFYAEKLFGARTRKLVRLLSRLG